MFDPWSKSVEIVENVYKRNNYRIEYSENKTGICVIYCSSNDIWYPNEEYAFITRIINNDQYEWLNLRVSYAEKEIFLRDIYKSWYVKGINEKVNTIDAIVELLHSEVQGYKIITVGSSAGGYLALILGEQLGADFVIAFSAQFELRNKWALDVNLFLQKNEHIGGKYYDLRPYIEKGHTTIYYICPIKNETDYYHYSNVKKYKSVRSLVFSSKRHGVVIPKCCIRKLFDMDQKTIDRLFCKYQNKMLNPIIFSVKMCGLIKTIRSLMPEGIKLIKGKLTLDFGRCLWKKK